MVPGERFANSLPRILKKLFESEKVNIELYEFIVCLTGKHRNIPENDINDAGV